MEPNKRVLVAPLDWGLGHATRCIPIIQELLNKNCTVFIASSGRALYLLQKEFPDIKCFEIAGYNPVYPEGSAMVFKMALQLPKFLNTIKNEHRQIEKIVHRNKIDVVISDNRYGAYSTKAYSVIITHQLNLIMPNWFKWMQVAVNKYNHYSINKFKQCWVPAPQQSFASKLTDAHSSDKIKHIGFLSRFKKQSAPILYDVCVICSGPDPQRGIFERMLRAQLKETNLTYVIVKGKTESLNRYYKKSERENLINFLNTEELNMLIEQSSLIVSRSGYSTIMDLARLNKKAIFIPTPGQTEQEFLAEQLKKDKIAYSIEQDNFELTEALEESKKYTGFNNPDYDNALLEKAISSVL